MKFKANLEKRGPCACGKTILKRGHDFIADIDTATLHTRKRCRALMREDVFGTKYTSPVQDALDEIRSQRAQKATSKFPGNT